MVGGYCYRVSFEDGEDLTTNYVGAVLQVGDTINLDGEHWVVTDANVVSERDVDFEIHVRRTKQE
jgi:hypothetical protein